MKKYKKPIVERTKTNENLYLTKITIDDGTSSFTFDPKQTQKDHDLSAFYAGLYCINELGLLQDDLLQSNLFIYSIENLVLKFYLNSK